jgi:hypothetical protein
MISALLVDYPHIDDVKARLCIVVDSLTKLFLNSI